MTKNKPATDSRGKKEAQTNQMWAWRDRWEGNFKRQDSYPALWDKLAFKPTIVTWEGNNAV